MKQENLPPGADLINSHLTYNYSTYTVGIMAYWMDDNFQLHQEVLAFERLRGHHTDENMSSIVLEVLGNYGITDKLFCITPDNTGNNGTLYKSLKAKLAELGIPWDHEVNSFPWFH